MTPVRDRAALGLAVLAHLLLAGLLRLIPPSSPTQYGATAAIEVALDEARVDDAIRRDPSGEPIAGSATAAGAATEKDSVWSKQARHVASRTPLEREHTAGAPAAEAFAPAPDPGWTFNPARRSPVDIGIGAHWTKVAGGAHAQGAEATSAEAAARLVNRAMRDGLATRDVELGLGRAGPLVAATREAAASPEAPDVGATTLEVESDAAGSVVAVRADDRAWDGLAAALVRRMAGKPLRVPSGVRGIRARLRVAAERTLPAGVRGSSSPGAVPDDVAGSANKACEGHGVTRRCVAGMPVGVTKSGGDLSNLGANVVRVVHVQLLEEAEL